MYLVLIATVTPDTINPRHRNHVLCTPYVVALPRPPSDIHSGPWNLPFYPGPLGKIDTSNIKRENLGV